MTQQFKIVGPADSAFRLVDRQFELVPKLIIASRYDLALPLYMLSSPFVDMAFNQKGNGNQSGFATIILSTAVWPFFRILDKAGFYRVLMDVM